MKRSWLSLALLLVATPAAAQMNHDMNHGDAASLAGIRTLYESVRGFIVAAAEQMPEANYSFKPTPEVRSFGQLVGHVANAGWAFCSGATGDKASPAGDAEKMSSKAEIVAALKASFAYCDKAYGMSGDKSAEKVTFFGQPHTRLSVLAFNMGHDFEHYGNIVTYMRMKGMVPPSSQPSGG